MKEHIEGIMQGLNNFRDLGGYKTSEGKTIKSGYLYRSNSLDALQDSDIAFLEEKGFKLIVDYRPASERENTPNIPIAGSKYMNLEIGNGGLQELFFSKEFEKMENVDHLMPDYYRALTRETTVYKKLFELILEQENLPMLQHCAAGKDRTGMGVAFILLALGVPESVVMTDYLLSNEYRKQINESILSGLKSNSMSEKELAFINALLGVQKEYLEAAFDEIKIQHGSVDSYLSNALGLTQSMRQELQHRFLI